jgi:hypothetical protein
MNSNINFNYDVDYSKDKSIDKRVLEVCAIAEANFLKNLKKTNSRNITDIRDLIINNNNNDNFKIMFANNDTKKALETSRPNVQNRSFFSSSKIGKIGNKSISLEKNLLSQRYYNNNQKNQVNSNFICFKNRLNKQIVNSKNFDQNFSGTKLYLKQNNKINNENKSFSGISKSQRNFNFRSRMKNQQIERSINLNKKSTIQEELKSNNNFNNFIQTNSSMVRQYKPLFSKTINKSYIFPHIQHIKNKNKYELSKILLKTQNLINRKKYLLAYNLLKEIISTGEYHSDLFYLFGEVNRILKNYQNAENYLLLALNFEIHSPKVFYSMGLLYQELKQYDYSNIFLKLYIRLIDNDNAHYLRAKNYALMGNYLKAAKEMTIAIEMNNECDYYYKFRSEIYNKLGLNEISNEDLNMYNFIKNKKIEENK